MPGTPEPGLRQKQAAHNLQQLQLAPARPDDLYADRPCRIGARSGTPVSALGGLAGGKMRTRRRRRLLAVPLAALALVTTLTAGTPGGALGR
jgi:hypothetical protein